MGAPLTQTRSGAGPSDAALVVATRAGEDWACEALFRRYAPMVNALAFRLLGRDDELDDLVQESFVDALGSLAGLREPQAFAAWMSAIVVRRTAKLLRRRKLMGRLGLRRPMSPIDVDAIVSRTAPPDDVAELRAVYRIVDALPTDVRIALLLRRVEGHSLEEIATLTGTSLATVKRKIAAGDMALHDEGGAR